MMSAKCGKVYLVGAGPGDPKLITLKGIECLQRADVVIYDLLVNVKLLEHASPHAKKIYGGKMAGEQERLQSEINELMVQHATAGKTVVRLKGGDPFVFGRGGEEALILANAGIDFEIVPGISSAIAAPAYAGIPVTHREYASSVAIVTGHSAALGSDSPVRWEQLSTAVDTLVVLMGIGHLRQITERLINYGRNPETSVALIHWGTTPQQETLEGTLADIAHKAESVGFRSPAAIVVGEVNTLRNDLRWYDRKPLFARTIVVTRARAQISELAEKLESYGAQTVQFPTIEIQPINDNAAFDAAIGGLAGYNWIIFTSVNAVEIFYCNLRKSGGDSRSFGDARICAVGQKTVEALDRIGIRTDFVPSRSHSAAIAAELEPVTAQKILVPRARIASHELPDGLRERGAIVDVIPIYDTVIAGMERSEEIEADLLNGRIDMVTFTSASAITNFLDIFNHHAPAALLEKVHTAVIGPSTASTAQRSGLTVDVIANETTIENLAEEIAIFYAGKESKS